MPELPEVEAARRLLTRWTVGRKVTAVDVKDAARLALAPADLVGRTIAAWTRHGKWLLAPLDDGTHALVGHLGMTGKWVADPAPDRPYQRVVLTFAKAARKPRAVALIDPRRWGELAVVPLASDPTAQLGPDALAAVSDAHFGVAGLRKALEGARPSATALLKDRLVDQARLAGLGNIAASEIAFRARLSPYAKIGALTPAAWSRLVDAIREHLVTTIAALDGHAEIDYLSDGADNTFLVYGREGLPCPRCQTPIVRTVRAARATFHCPRCQSERP
jgi:formamidopyrimidine-DNA glycosylase